MAHGGQKNIKAHKDHGRRAHGADKATRKARAKAQDPRYQEAMNATQRARASLDELIAEQASSPALGETPGAIYQRRQRELALERAQVIEDEYAQASLVAEQDAKDHEEIRSDLVLVKPRQPKVVEVECDRVYVKHVHEIDTKELPRSGDGNWAFSYQTARIMLKEGYNIKKVIEYTGIGLDDLSDIPIDSEGYVVVDEEEDENA
jgi:hypothetical protein